MNRGTNYSVTIIAPDGRPIFKSDVHMLLMRMWYSNCLPVTCIEGVSIEIERDGLRVEKRLPGWRK